MTAVKRLMTEYRELTNNAPEGILAGKSLLGNIAHSFIGPVDESNFFDWECYITGPQGTPFEGGIFPATLTFPKVPPLVGLSKDKDYPLSPPTMKFVCDIFHPNVYKDGTVCISILHPPGDDPNHYELSSERWSPVQSVEKILLSVMSMLAEPNDESGANIDACKVWREDREQYNKIVRELTRKTLGL